MPTFAITYTVKEKKRTIAQTIRLMAIGETHARQRFFEYARNTLKKFARIMHIKEES